MIGVGAYRGGSSIAIGTTIRPSIGATIVIGKAIASLVTSKAIASVML